MTREKDPVNPKSPTLPPFYATPRPPTPKYRYALLPYCLTPIMQFLRGNLQLHAVARAIKAHQPVMVDFYKCKYGLPVDRN
jgi:hypothetical protein